MRKIAYLLLTVAIFVSVNAFAQEQEQKTPTPEEMAAKEADRLGELLKLDDWQIFYVDSTLQHDYTLYQEDVKNVDEELNGESGIEAYIKQLYLDNTHITLKIKRALAWLIFAHYSTTMTKDKQGERWVTDSEIPIFLFAKRV